MEAFKLGPFGFSTRLALALLGLVVAFALAQRLARKDGVDVDKPLWLILLAGALAGRIPFVVAFRDSYLDAPWRILDIRDGGFNAATGIAGALIVAFLLTQHLRALRKPLFISLAAGTLLWGGGTALLSASRQDQALPAIALADLDGRTVDIARFRGKPVVLNLWASWCPPCRREMPVLHEAQRANPDVMFVFANRGEPAETVRAYLATERLALDNVLLDFRGELASAVGAVAMPTTLFYDRSGRLAATRVGEVSAATLAQRLQALRASP